MKKYLLCKIQEILQNYFMVKKQALNYLQSADQEFFPCQYFNFC